MTDKDPGGPDVNTKSSLDVAAAFVSIATALAEGYETVDLFAVLTVHCASLLDVACAGLLLADGRGVLHLMAASSQRTHDNELFQLQRTEGPCLDCFHAGAPVLVPDLAREAARWPHFVPAGLAAGFASVHALPMRRGGEFLGTLGLFGTTPRTLDKQDLVLAQALAHVASIALAAEPVAGDQVMINDRLEGALRARATLEQANGMLAEDGGLDLDQAMAVLRAWAREHDQTLTEVAQALVDRNVSTAELRDPAHDASPLDDAEHSGARPPGTRRGGQAAGRRAAPPGNGFGAEAGSDVVEWDAEVAQVFAHVARRLQGAASRKETWQRVVDSAAELLPEFEHAAISLIHPHGRIDTVAATGEVGPAVDAIQYETGQGPCLSAIREQEVFVSGDLAAEDRWPEFTKRAVTRTAVRSMLSFTLFVQEETLGALNLYSHRVDAFDERARTIGAVLAAHAAIAMAAADEHAHLAQLKEAVSTNREIGVAVGIAMTQTGATSGAAFAMLREVSSRTNVKLAAIAARLVAEAAAARQT